MDIVDRETYWQTLRWKISGFSFFTGSGPGKCYLSNLSSALELTVNVLTPFNAGYNILIVVLPWTGNKVLDKVFDAHSTMRWIEADWLFTLVAPSPSNNGVPTVWTAIIAALSTFTTKCCVKALSMAFFAWGLVS